MTREGPRCAASNRGLCRRVPVQRGPGEPACGQAPQPGPFVVVKSRGGTGPFCGFAPRFGLFGHSRVHRRSVDRLWKAAHWATASAACARCRSARSRPRRGGLSAGAVPTAALPRARMNGKPFDLTGASKVAFLDGIAWNLLDPCAAARRLNSTRRGEATDPPEWRIRTANRGRTRHPSGRGCHRPAGWRTPTSAAPRCRLARREA